ncbi:MAG: DUF3794 domain-containing protein [Roseburia sp.]|nr:DUF3794 domain-containing protein [Roseburia sp.]
MDLKTIQLHKNCQKGIAVNQITVDDDYNVPDYKPDIVKMVKEKGEVRFDEVNVTTGVVWIKGSLVFSALYRSNQENRKMSSLRGELPFQEKISMDGLNETDSVRMKAEIEDLTIGAINSRKLSIRAVVVLKAIVEENREEEMACGIAEDDGYEQQLMKKDLLELVTARRDTLRVRNEIVIPSSKPNVSDILWKSIELRHLEYTGGDGEIKVTGEALVTVFYYGEEDEGRIQWNETSVPISGSIDCPGLSGEEIFQVSLAPLTTDLEVKPDYDGEERILVLELVFDVSLKVWRETQVELLNDLYSLKKEVNLTCEDTTLERLLMKNDAKSKVSEQLQLEENQEKILQICACEGTVLLEEQKLVPNGVEVDGILSVDVLYMTTEDDMPLGVMKGVFPFHQLIEAQGLTPQSRAEVDSGIEQLSAVLLDQSKAEIKVVINLNLMAFEEEKQKKIKDVEVTDWNLEELQDAPGIVGYLARPGDTLWKIAKENHTTVDEIVATNQLKDKKIAAGDQLLVVKKVL